VRGVITPGRVVSEGDGKENRKEEIGGRFSRFGTGQGRESVGRAVLWVRCLLEVATAYLFLWDSFFYRLPGRAPVWEREGLCSRAAVFRAVVFPTFRGAEFLRAAGSGAVPRYPIYLRKTGV